MILQKGRASESRRTISGNVTHWIKGTCLHVSMIYGITECLQPPKNIFDTVPSLSDTTRNELCDELDRYLGADPEMVDDILIWWHERRETYPSLSRMALDYLTIPGAFSLPLLKCKHSCRIFIPTSNIRRCRTYIQQWQPAFITCSQSAGITVNPGGNMLRIVEQAGSGEGVRCFCSYNSC